MSGAGAPLVRLSGLEISAPDGQGGTRAIVRDISLAVQPGEVLALIGESGSGKTTIALSMLGYTRGACHISGGTVEVAGHACAGGWWPMWRKARRRPSTPCSPSCAR
jgi:peptide/nickel transport system ATP-binding protein